MDITTALVEVFKSLVWPIAIGLFIYKFRMQVESIMQRIVKIAHGSTTIELGPQVKLAEEKLIGATGPTGPLANADFKIEVDLPAEAYITKVAKPDLSKKSRTFETSNRTLMLGAWAKTEDAIVKYSKKVGLHYAAGNDHLLEVIRNLGKSGKIPYSVIEIVEPLIEAVKLLENYPKESPSESITNSFLVTSQFIESIFRNDGRIPAKETGPQGPTGPQFN